MNLKALMAMRSHESSLVDNFTPPGPRWLLLPLRSTPSRSDLPPEPFWQRRSPGWPKNWSFWQREPLHRRISTTFKPRLPNPGSAERHQDQAAPG